MIATPRILIPTLLVACTAVFFSCEEGATVTESGTTVAADDLTGPNIVYVRVDSLQTGYTVVAEELKRLEANLAEAENNHNARVQALQQEVQRVQNKVQRGELAPNQVQAEQQRIARREQEIMQQQQMSIQSIQEDQLRIQRAFSERVKEILDEIQEEAGYDYILNRSIGSPVLIAKDEYDITPEVLVRLNAVRDSL